jgi:DNA-binding HxlR family transcriptional regulator
MDRQPRSGCPIATTLDLVGDRWTLVILRDLLTGKSRFSQFVSSPEKITTNILTNRLETMLDAGLVTKAAYQQNPRRYAYALTKKGEALLPVLQAMSRWANVYIPGTWTPPESFMARKVG